MKKNKTKKTTCDSEMGGGIFGYFPFGLKACLQEEKSQGREHSKANGRKSSPIHTPQTITWALYLGHGSSYGYMSGIVLKFATAHWVNANIFSPPLFFFQDKAAEVLRS